MRALLVPTPAAALCLLVLALSCIISSSSAFVPASSSLQRHATSTQRIHVDESATALRQTQSVFLETDLDDDKITQLYAWVSRALAGDPRYGNLMYAMAAVFGSNLDDDSPLTLLLNEAMKKIPEEEETVGEPFSLAEREEASLGAMGAAQWTGQWRTRPHALLELEGLESVDEWVKTLPRGCKRTLKKALAQNFTVTEKPIYGDKPAPHSSLAHFRCVVEHEVRLLSGDGSPEYFFDALSEAISRYIGTTRMAGVIQEYRDNESDKVIAIAHEVTKGTTVRGQWFYATDDASKRYVWFHSVHQLVERAIADDSISVVDLGPSGSDAFSELKARYGFVSVTDWPQMANYLGPFRYPEGVSDGTDGVKLGLFERLFE